MARRRFSEREVIETLAWQRIFVDCFRCWQPFCEIDEAVLRWVRIPQREHLHEVALGGPDTPKNCRYSCEECHARITNGTKATSAGSSKQRIAKINRIAGKTKNKPKAKIRSRGFQKVHRPMRRMAR